MSVTPLGNMHPMGGYDDYDGISTSELPRACPQLPEKNPETSGKELEIFARVNQSQLIYAKNDLQLIEDKYCKYDDLQPCPVAVIMGNLNWAMTIRLTQIPEAIAQGWTLLGICDEASANIAVWKISRAYRISGGDGGLGGSRGFVPLYEFFINRGLPNLIKLHMLGQTLGLVYVKFLEKIAHEIAYYSGLARFAKFFYHYLFPVKDGGRYPLIYECESPNNPLP